MPYALPYARFCFGFTGVLELWADGSIEPSQVLDGASNFSLNDLFEVSMFMGCTKEPSSGDGVSHVP